MIITQILNFIRLQNLRCCSYSAFLFALLFLGSCNREPVPCISIEPNTIQLGQETTISDCSEHSFNNELKTGEGGNFSNITSMEWAYNRPGTYQISLKTFSKKGNKDATEIQYIVVSPPDSNKIKGRWKLTVIEQREQLFVDNSLGLFENKLVNSDTLNETYSITLDSLFVKHDIDNFLLFLNAYEMEYDYKNATIKVNNSLFEIVVFEENTMIWKGSFVKGYSLLYLTKI